MLAHAPKGRLNHSNNPTFIKYSEKNDVAQVDGLNKYLFHSGSDTYQENDKMSIKNIVKSPYTDFSESFKKIVYISKIGIYDKDKNLIAVAKLANPVKKREDRDFTFRLKMDL